MFVSCECCVLSDRGLCRADHLSRGVLPNVVCPISMIAKPLRGGQDPESGQRATGKKNWFLYIFRARQTRQFHPKLLAYTLITFRISGNRAVLFGTLPHVVSYVRRTSVDMFLTSALYSTTRTLYEEEEKKGNEKGEKNMYTSK